MRLSSILPAMLLLWPMTVGSARAQLSPPVAQDTAVMELQLRKEPPIEKGQVAVVQGTTAAKGLRFRLNSLSVLQPVIATVLARDENADLRVSLLKPGDEAPRLSASTHGEGSATLSTRTQGGLDLVIDGPSGTPFALMVWVSDELTPRLASVVVRPEEYQAWAAAHPQSVRAASNPERPLAPAEDHKPTSTAGLILTAFLAGGTLVLVTVLVVRRKHA